MSATRENVSTISPENFRHERKFAVEAEQIPSLFYVLKLHPALFIEAYAERRVNSIYFDTDDYSYYMDTVLGKVNRHKVRLRWYGNQVAHIDNGKFEIKAKSGYLGTKETFDFGTFPIDDLLANYQDYIRASEFLPAVYQNRFSFLRPIILVSYLRRYFISADRRFRITLDYDLCFYDVKIGFNPLRKVPSDACVLELKYQPENDEAARRIAESFPYRYSRSSKYRIGLEAI